MPIPHYHDRRDETIYGWSGTSTGRIDGKDVDLAPGETVFIKRGVVLVHEPDEQTGDVPVRAAPRRAGPGYFWEIAALLLGGALDPVRMKEAMLRYGLVPVE
jgi:hypothetical protein